MRARARSKVLPRSLISDFAIAMKFSNSAPRDCANGDCADVAPQLTALFDGEADDAQTREARAHLLSCPACSRQWLDWTRYRDTFQSEPAPIVPPTLLWRVLIAYRVTAFARPARRRSRLPQVSATPLRGIEAPLPPRLSQHILARTTRKSGAHVMLTPGKQRAACRLIALERALVFVWLGAAVGRARAGIVDFDAGPRRFHRHFARRHARFLD